ncbi:MAG: phosphate/phosphite/phosphonate ABC transporter substrate-binding protein [Desulfobulbaceae bacterium]|nr:phosphate/phosphite/phosphonate ABC transporter substrate-binding protein [Desulfobulbaceae bacterium]
MKRKKLLSFVRSGKAGLVFLFFMALIFFYPSTPGFSSAKPLRVGVASMVTPVSAVQYYQQIVDYLADKLAMPAEMVHRTTYDEIDRMLEQQQVDVAFICSFPYVDDKDAFGVELLVAPVIDGKASYRSYIIAHRDSNISSIEDLEGKSFVFVDPKSNTGRQYPLYLLARQGSEAGRFFSRYFFSYSHNKSVEMVAKKKADGAAVDSAVYAYMLAENSPYAKQVKIIHQSPEFGSPPVVAPPGLPVFMKNKIRDILVAMHLDPEGREILSAMRIDRFVGVPDSNYDLIREMRDFLHLEQIVTEGIAASPAKEPEKERIYHFGVIPRDNPRIAYEKYQPLLDYLADVTGLRLELLLNSTYEQTVMGLGTGQTDFALLGPLTYLDAYNRFGTPPIVKSKTEEGDPFFYSVIVAAPETPLQGVAELKGKKMAFASIWSTSGNLMPRYMLAWSGIHLDELDRYTNYSYHETVVKKVLSREYDAGGIRRSVARRYLPFGLKIIATSDPIPTGPIVVSPQTPYAVVRKVQEALLSMDAKEKGRQVLQQLDADMQGGFISASDADYSGIRKMINDVPVTCGMGCHPKTTF